MRRSELDERFADPATVWKTFVIEAHDDGDAGRLLTTAAPEALITANGDPHLHLLHVGDLDLVVDTLDSRFWSVHTWSSSADAYRFLGGVIGRRRDLDWTWLPTGHLESLSRAGTPMWLRSEFQGDRALPMDDVVRLRLRVQGTDSVGLLRHVADAYGSSVALDQVGVLVEDQAYGSVSAYANRRGRFVGSGDSFALYQALLADVIGRYRAVVDALERRRLVWSGSEERGAHVQGTAVAVEFGRPIADLGRFLDAVFSSREPFRLWGVPRAVDPEFWTVEAVDLHVGHRLRVEGGRTWLRVLLPDGACGNTLARLVANLQHHYDAQVRFGDAELQRLLEPSVSAA